MIKFNRSIKGSILLNAEGSIKMALFDVIRFDGLKSREWLIYKYPTDQIVVGSHLIVQEGQVEIFVKSGTICDIFYPGTNVLSTENLPIINKLVDLPFGGKTPFSAEVYFINTTTKLDIQWGTTDPIQLIDPKYFVRLRIRAFGQMGLKLQDYATFFQELIGGMNQDDIIKYEKIKDYYRGLIVVKIKSIISDTIISDKISALEVATKLEELSLKAKEAMSTEFEQYGFAIANFYIQSINFPEEDFEKINKILEDKAAFEIMGDNRYLTKRSFDVYEGAANNQNGVAGAFAAGGLGLGMGVNLSNNLQESKLTTTVSDSMKECPVCHIQNSSKSKFCPECGFNYSKLICECGNKLDINSKFCPECGKKVIINGAE
jgi:membrane protease subunit (stomatin/prohibitin family)